MTGKNILVVGGAGYIGSYMCKLLYRNGYKVIILDNLSTGFQHAAKYGKLYVADINESYTLDRIFQDENIDAVFHFAAFSQVAESVQNPMKYFKNNVQGTINLLNKMIQYNVKKFIFSSTAAIFGNPEYLPIDENHPKNPINPYGKSKLMIEEILEDLFKANELTSVSLRYFNAAGADPEGELGENHNPETHLIPIVLQTAYGKRNSINIFGNDYDTKDGTCIRDYIHINDLCKAHLLALEYLQENKVQEQFNLGNGEGYSIKEILSKSQEVTKKLIPCLISERRSGDPAVLISDSSKAKQILKWEPVLGIDDIIKDAWNWQCGIEP